MKKHRILPTSIGETYQIIKDSFKNIIQDVLGAKLNGHLGYENIKQVNLQIQEMDIHQKLQEEL